MGHTRRELLRWLGLGVLGVGAGPPVARAERRMRILGGGGSEPPDPGAGQRSRELARVLAGVRVGDTGRHKGLAVVWLHAAAPSPPWPVATLEEARARGALLITERELATVPELVVENRGKAYVLLLAGEILLGGKQNRVLAEDILLPPLSGPRPIGVYCVEAGRWAGRTKDFEARGSFAAPGLRSRVMERAGQDRIWAEVDRYGRMTGAASPTRSYQEIYYTKDVAAHLVEVERAFDPRAAAGARGAAVFVGAGLAGLDLFVSPDLFAREWPKLLRAHALDAFRQPEPRAWEEGALRGRVEEVLRAAALAEGSLRTNAGVGELFEFRVGGLRGAALTYEGHVVHAGIL